MDLKGMLTRQSPDSKPRMTFAQNKLVADAVDDALQHYCTEPDDVRVLARRVIQVALGAWPSDRSCYTCSYQLDGYCAQWQADIPNADAGNAGCPSWQDGGAPF